MQHRNEMKEKRKKWKNETNKRRNTIVNKKQCEMILSQTNLINVLIAPKSLFPPDSRWISNGARSSFAVDSL